MWEEKKKICFKFLMTQKSSVHMWNGFILLGTASVYKFEL